MSFNNATRNNFNTTTTPRISSSEVDADVQTTLDEVEPGETIDVNYTLEFDPGLLSRIDFLSDDTCNAGLFQMGVDADWELLLDGSSVLTGGDCYDSSQNSYSTQVTVPPEVGTYQLELIVTGSETGDVLAEASTMINATDDPAGVTPPTEPGSGDIVQQLIRILENYGIYIALIIIAIVVLSQI